MTVRIRVATALAVYARAVAPAHGQPTRARLTVESPAFEQNGAIPRQFTPDGNNVSPPLRWSGVPSGTREFAVVCADFGAGNPPPWVHWIVYGIPATAKGLPENLPIEAAAPMPASIAGAQQGLNGWRRCRATFSVRARSWRSTNESRNRWH